MPREPGTTAAGGRAPASGPRNASRRPRSPRSRPLRAIDRRGHRTVNSPMVVVSVGPLLPYPAVRPRAGGPHQARKRERHLAHLIGGLLDGRCWWMRSDSHVADAGGDLERPRQPCGPAGRPPRSRGEGLADLGPGGLAAALIACWSVGENGSWSTAARRTPPPTSWSVTRRARNASSRSSMSPSSTSGGRTAGRRSAWRWRPPPSAPRGRRSGRRASAATPRPRLRCRGPWGGGCPSR